MGRTTTVEGSPFPNYGRPSDRETHVRYVLEPSDELNHDPGEEPTYNESMYLNAFDADQGTGAWVRIGNRVNEGYAEVTVRVSLSPAWSSDWITEAGREALRAHGLSAPGPVQAPAGGPVALTLLGTRRALACPRCGSDATELVSEFGATACKAMYRCTECAEPFEHVKEI